jgi:hypothetical protein
MSITNYEATYSGMSDDEILRVACEESDLRDDARNALNGELKRRRLTEKDVSEYGQHLASIKPGAMLENQRYVARSVLGFGTSIYGKRDFHSDGSYTTTKWVTLLWLPVLPLGSLRVGKMRDGTGTAKPRLTKHYVGHFSWWTTRYWVYSEEPINKKQALFVYAFILLLFVTAKRAAYLPPWTFLVPFGSVCILPWVLRVLGRANSSR